MVQEITCFEIKDMDFLQASLDLLLGPWFSFITENFPSTQPFIKENQGLLRHHWLNMVEPLNHTNITQFHIVCPLNLQRQVQAPSCTSLLQSFFQDLQILLIQNHLQSAETAGAKKAGFTMSRQVLHTETRLKLPSSGNGDELRGLGSLMTSSAIWMEHVTLGWHRPCHPTNRRCYPYAHFLGR